MRETKTKTHLMFKFNRRDWNQGTGEACQSFIAEMKRTIPAQFRIFNGEVNQWSISIEYAGVIRDLKQKYLN
jgi:hypothetical protein